MWTSIRLRHSSAHLLHSLAHCEQYSRSEFCSHSFAQTSHMVAHSPHNIIALSPPIANNCALAEHTKAHSRVMAIQSDNILMSSSFKHSVAQCWHAVTLDRHALIQSLKFWLVMLSWFSYEKNKFRNILERAIAFVTHSSFFRYSWTGQIDFRFDFSVKSEERFIISSYL